MKDILKLIEAHVLAYHGPLALESILSYIEETALTNLDTPISEAEEEIQEFMIVERETADTPLLFIMEDADLLEATLNHFFAQERRYKKDKDGKRITGRHHATKRYSGSRKERMRQAAREYYSDPKHAEEQRIRMRERRAEEKKAEEEEQFRGDIRKAEEEGRHVSDVTRERKLAKKKALSKKRSEARIASMDQASETRERNAEATRKAAREKRERQQEILRAKKEKDRETAMKYIQALRNRR